MKSNFQDDNTLRVMRRSYSVKYGLANDFRSAPLKWRNIYHGDVSYTLGNVVPVFSSFVHGSRKIVKDKLGIATGASAVSLNRKRSMISAFGEFIERESAIREYNVPAVSLHVDSYENMRAKGQNCVEPSEFIFFDEDQYDIPGFPFSKYTPRCRISWSKGKDLLNNENVWIPAQKALMTFAYAKGERPCIPMLSTGFACGSSYIQAALSSMYEVVERDSLMLTWYLRIPGIRIDVDRFSNDDTKAIYDHICKHLTGEDKLHIFNISKTSGIYTIVTYLRNELPNAYGIVIGNASNADPEIALYKSLQELVQCQRFGYCILFDNKEMSLQHMKKEDIDTLHMHYFYYSTGRHSSCIDFIAASDENALLSELPNYAKSTPNESLEYLADVFRKEGSFVYLVDVTKPEFSSEGFVVLKAVIPGYLDLDQNHNYRQLNNKRLIDFKEKYGVQDFNDDPHPFP